MIIFNTHKFNVLTVFMNFNFFSILIDYYKVVRQ